MPGLPAFWASWVFAVAPLTPTCVFASTANTPVSAPRSTVTDEPVIAFTLPTNDSVACAHTLTPESTSAVTTAQNTLRFIRILLR